MSARPRIWVVGASGMLGQALCQALKKAEAAPGLTCIGTGSELDVTDADRTLQFAQAERPTHIINCAAFTHVDNAEKEEARALRVNGDGPYHLACAAQALQVPLVHVSTDYVFSGDANAPYTEAMEVGPTGAYGRTKLAGESSVFRALDPSLAYVVRTSWLFGPGGTNFVATMLRLFKERERVQVVGDQLGRPTYTPDLAHALLRLVGLNAEGATPAATGLYHFANANQTSWHGFAEATYLEARRRGFPLACREVQKVTTAEFPRPAKRPAYSVLATSRFATAAGYAPRPWQDALNDYLALVAPHHSNKESACAG